MEKLSHHLLEIGKIVDQWGLSTDSLKDCKNTKADLFAMDRVIQILTENTNALKQAYLARSAALEKKATELSTTLGEFEKFFNITAKETKKPDNLTVESKVNEEFALQEYKFKEDIPYLQYGVVNGMILYRFSKTDFVSCTNVMIMDNNMGDNFRSICCTNGARCQYGKDCKYFHDPLLWPGSNHVQRFPKSNLVKQCPFFGHANMIVEQLQTVSFDNLRTLARYVAIMGLLIHRAANKN